MSDVLEIMVSKRAAILKYTAGWWRGLAGLEDEDIKLGEGGKLPPKELAKLGVKQVYPKEKLNIFGALDKRVRDFLLAGATRMLDGDYLVGEDRFNIVAKELEDIRALFEAEVEKLLAEYDAVAEEWAVKNPDFASEIREGKLPLDRIRAKFRFRWRMFHIVPAAQPGNLAEDLEEIPKGVLGEAAQMAREVMRNSIEGKPPRLRRAIASPLRRIRGKLAATAFLNPDVEPMVAELDKLLAAVPAEGFIEGGTYHWLVSVVRILMDPTQMRLFAKGLVQPRGEAADEDEEAGSPGTTGGCPGQGVLPIDVARVAPAAAAPEVGGEAEAEAPEPAEEVTPEAGMLPSPVAAEAPASDAVDTGFNFDSLSSGLEEELPEVSGATDDGQVSPEPIPVANPQPIFGAAAVGWSMDGMSVLRQAANISPEPKPLVGQPQMAPAFGATASAAAGTSSQRRFSRR